MVIFAIICNYICKLLQLPLWGGDAELICHPDQLGQGPGFHLGHHVLAVHFHGGLARAGRVPRDNG